MKHVKIRTATKNDILSILDLLYELQRPKPKTKSEKIKFTKQILRYLSEEDKKILVAEDSTKIIGLVAMMFLPRLNRTKKELYIPELVVKKGYMRLGIGKLLIKSSIHTGKRKNCFRIRLESGNQRKEAHQFYRDVGFDQSAQSYSLNLAN
jgi:ribosomal protein S18 acetylase RimI-like enzyme